MKISNWILCIVIFGALLGTSCEKLIEHQIKKVVKNAVTNDDKATDDAPPPMPEKEEEGDPAITNALNIYTGCINKASKSVLSSRRRYFSWAKNDTTKLPSTRSRLRNGLYSVKTQTDTCLKQLTTLKDAKLFPLLHMAGKKYKTALAAL